MTDDELDRLPTETLVDALRRRFDACIFAALQSKHKDNVDIASSYHGEYVVLFGLIEMVKSDLVTDMQQISDEKS